MKAQSLIILIATLALLGACSSQLKWTSLDGNNAAEAELEAARKTCRTDRKLANLENAESERDKDLKLAKTNESKMLVKDDFETVKRQVYQEIDTCMFKQGYKR